MTDRGISVTVSYALSLAVATVLVSALMMTAGGLIENRQQEVYRNELQVVGNGVAADLMAVDRLASSGADDVELIVSTPRRVGGSSYEIDIRTDGGDATLVLETRTPEVIVTVPLQNTTVVESGTTNGGSLRIHYTAGGTIEVEPV